MDAFHVKPSYSRLVQLVRSIMNRLSAISVAFGTLHGNDADPVDPKQTPGWQTALLVAAGPPLPPFGAGGQG